MFIETIQDVVRRQAGKTSYVFGTISSDKLRMLTFVPVLEQSAKTFLSEETKGGYQRPASLSRMRAFMRFVAQHPNSVIPPILLSGRGKWKFVTGPGASHGVLKASAPAAIVDGQHRVGGYVALHDEDGVKREVPFILLDGLTIAEEKEEFVIVNNSQKGVPRSLTSYLGDSEEAQIAWNLNTDSDSPFCGHITRTEMHPQHLFALHSVAKQVRRLFGVGPLRDLDADTKTTYAARFFSLVEDRLPEAWEDIKNLESRSSGGRKAFKYKLLELTGLIAWCVCGAQILSRSYGESSEMNWPNVERLIDYAARIDWSKQGQYAGRTGEAGGSVMAEDMLRLLPAETSTEAEDKRQVVR